MSIIDDIENAIHAVEATAEQVAARLATIGDWGTAGPDLVAHPPITQAPPSSPAFVDGWWSEAHRIDAHPGRIGPPIDPCCVVDHTTDMHPDDWDALLNALRTRAGDRACMQFLVGRTEAYGIVQLVPITRNGNHAGGPHHGVYVAGSGQVFHPNTLAVGIEFHCAGGQVRLVGNEWRYIENGVMHGAPIPASEIEADQARPGRGWHCLSSFQVAVRAKLHAALDDVMRPMPAGLVARSTGEAVPSWAVPRTMRFVGHVSLDPTDRADPWPPGMRALR